MMQKFINKPLMMEASIFNALPQLDWTEFDCPELSYEMREGIAVIPIHGLLTKRPEAFSSVFGTTSYEEIYDAIMQAQNDEQVKAILLDVDSPGGEVSGLFDLVDFIYNARDVKPIYSMANDSTFSAAYAIASATSKIFINRTSGVGSVGVIATHVDVSEADKKDGIKYTTVFAGDKKNDLSPHEPLTSGAIVDLQNEVNRLYEMFVKTVARNRKISMKAVRSTQAATYFGSNAIDVGFADEIVAGNDVFEKILKLGGKMDEQTDQFQEQYKAQYKAQIVEIAQLCKLAHAENKIAEYISQDLTAEQVREKLLAMVNTQEEISSTVYHKEAVKENPVVKAAKIRARMGA